MSQPTKEELSRYKSHCSYHRSKNQTPRTLESFLAHLKPKTPKKTKAVKTSNHEEYTTVHLLGKKQEMFKKAIEEGYDEKLVLIHLTKWHMHNRNRVYVRKPERTLGEYLDWLKNPSGPRTPPVKPDRVVKIVRGKQAVSKPPVVKAPTRLLTATQAGRFGGINLRRREKGLPLLTEEKFLELLKTTQLPEKACYLFDTDIDDRAKVLFVTEYTSPLLVWDQIKRETMNNSLTYERFADIAKANELQIDAAFKQRKTTY